VIRRVSRAAHRAGGRRLSPDRGKRRGGARRTQRRQEPGRQLVGPSSFEVRSRSATAFGDAGFDPLHRIAQVVSSTREATLASPIDIPSSRF